MPSKPYSQFPSDENLSPQSREALDYMLQQINQLVGQGNVPPGQRLQSFGSNIIDPTSNQIVSKGSRVTSIGTPITYTSTTTSISFFWDGTNGSQQFKLFRDDGSVVGPLIAGSGLTITGLSPSTTYFIYFYWNEVTKSIQFATLPGQGVGTPPAAFPALNYNAAQIQILQNHIPLAPNFSSTGIMTPAAGSGGGSGGGGGGGGGGGFCPLSGAPVKLYGDPAWWTKTVKPCWEFLEVVTESGRRGTFSRPHRMYQHAGLMPLYMWKVGDLAVTEDGEERVTELNPRRFEGEVDSYEATKGHVYSAWGFISHNLKP
jgi:hypothetical protein